MPKSGLTSVFVTVIAKSERMLLRRNDFCRGNQTACRIDFAAPNFWLRSVVYRAETGQPALHRCEYPLPHLSSKREFHITRDAGCPEQISKPSDKRPWGRG